MKDCNNAHGASFYLYEELNFIVKVVLCEYVFY